MNTAYSTTLAAANGTTPYSWSITSGSLPAGLALNPATGTISGTPTQSVTNTPLTVKVSDASSPAKTQTANLTLTVSATALTVTPATVNFGNVVVGSVNSQTLKVSNSGNGVLTITQVTVTGTGFSAGVLALPISLNPGQSSTFNVNFSPVSTGSTSGSVSITSNAASSPGAVPLSGNGVAATQTLSFSATSLTFGAVNVSQSSTQSVTITNTGNANVQISQINISGAGFTLSAAGTPVTLTPTQTFTFSILFNPTVAGASTGAVTVISNATGSPATITLSGTGVQHSVLLNWTATASTVSGYNVYRSTVSGSGYAKLNSSLVGSLTYTDATVQNGQTYYYVTTAVDASGTESTYSNELQMIIP
jgi:hypothetical protein